MDNFEIIISYRSIISVSVKADNLEEAKRIALLNFGIAKDRISSKKITIIDDCYKVSGYTNMTETWDSYTD